MQIPQAIQDFKKMGAKIKLYDGTICSTYYLLDETCIFAPFKHGKNKRSVPAFKVCSNGTFFDFCKKDIDKILEESIDYTETEVKPNEE